MKFTEKNLVLYKGQPAIIQSIVSDKIEITTNSGTKKVREKDIELLHKGPIQSLKSVLDYVLSNIDFTEIADFFNNEQALLTEIAELLFDTLPAEAWWALWNEVTNNSLFVATSPSQAITIRTQEEVKELEQKKQAKEQELAEKQAFIQRFIACMHTSIPLDLEQDAQYLQEIEALALGKTNASKLMEEAKLAQNQETAHKILHKTGYWAETFNPWPQRFGQSLKSAKSTIEPDALAPETDRLNLTDKTSWAIDNLSSTDPDDAIMYDKPFLWIHVADPASRIKIDSPVDLEARHRGATLYIPEAKSTMISESVLSEFVLTPSKNRPALSFRIELEENGSIKNVAIFKTLINVEALTYEQADLQKDNEVLAPFFAIAKKNNDRRLISGAVPIEFPEIYIQLTTDQDNAIRVQITPITSTESSKMIQEMMLIAGEAAARFAFKNNIPFQYIGQDEPDIPKKLPEGLAGEYRKRKSMRPRKVGTIPQDHAGIGLGMYSQVTSPLRRYGDLVAHQQLHLFLENKPLMSTDQLLMSISQGDAATRETNLAERKTRTHWTLVFLKQNPSWQGEAIILEHQGNDSAIIIPELNFESKIKGYTNRELNSLLQVRVGAIDLYNQTASFIEVKE